MADLTVKAGVAESERSTGGESKDVRFEASPTLENRGMSFRNLASTRNASMRSRSGSRQRVPPPPETPPFTHKSTVAIQQIQQRLERHATKHSLVAQSADDSRVLLDDFASAPAPQYDHAGAIIFGSFIDWLILTRIPVGGKLTRALVRCGGAEQ
eukprot:1511263-Prymnesium_polylepis.1